MIYLKITMFFILVVIPIILFKSCKYDYVGLNCEAPNFLTGDLKIIYSKTCIGQSTQSKSLLDNLLDKIYNTKETKIENIKGHKEALKVSLNKEGIKKIIIKSLDEPVTKSLWRAVLLSSGDDCLLKNDSVEIKNVNLCLSLIEEMKSGGVKEYNNSVYLIGDFSDQSKFIKLMSGYVGKVEMLNCDVNSTGRFWRDENSTEKSCTPHDHDKKAFIKNSNNTYSAYLKLAN